MLQSSEVAHLKPSNVNNKSYILGIEIGFLLIRLFSSLKLDLHSF